MSDAHDPDRRACVLTQKDVEAIAAALEKRITQRFFLNVGKGILAFAWRGILLGLIALAAFGAYGAIKHPGG